MGAWNLATFSAGYLTPVALATHQIALNYASITYMVPLGISAAAAVSVGHAVGAGDAARARRAGWLALGLGTGFMLLAAVVFLVAPRPLIELYTQRCASAGGGAGLLGIVAAFQIFDGIQTVSTGALRGLGETRAPMVANLVGYWVLGLPLGFFLCFGLQWGIYGLWIGLTLALVVIATDAAGAVAAGFGRGAGSTQKLAFNGCHDALEIPRRGAVTSDTDGIVRA